MKNKYFTPDIEDICIGYEYEQLVTPLSESLGKSEEEWMKCKFPDPFTIDRILLLYERKEQLRVPYLTKEQIEAEEWTYTGKISTRNMPCDPFNKIELEFIKDDVSLAYDIISNILKISKVIDVTKDIEYKITTDLFYGKCKDINTFRKITKLLGI